MEVVVSFGMETSEESILSYIMCWIQVEKCEIYACRCVRSMQETFSRSLYHPAHQSNIELLNVDQRRRESEAAYAEAQWRAVRRIQTELRIMEENVIMLTYRVMGCAERLLQDRSNRAIIQQQLNSINFLLDRCQNVMVTLERIITPVNE